MISRLHDALNAADYGTVLTLLDDAHYVDNKAIEIRNAIEVAFVRWNKESLKFIADMRVQHDAIAGPSIRNRLTLCLAALDRNKLLQMMSTPGLMRQDDIDQLLSHFIRYNDPKFTPDETDDIISMLHWLQHS